MTTIVEQSNGRGVAGHVRLLEGSDLPALVALSDQQRLVNLFVRSRLDLGSRSGLGRSWLGTQWWGFIREGRLESACHIGANIVPIEATPAAAEAFALRLARREPRGGSIVGPADAVLAMWRLIEPSWGTAREVRPEQPFLVLPKDSLVPGDPRVRAFDASEIEIVHPAAEAMFREEVGIDPDPSGSGAYRSRVRELLVAGHTFGITEDGPRGPYVVAKVDVGIATPHAVQLQGVWVHPQHRGRGLAGPMISAVVREVRRSIAPTVTLYVNSWNEPARRSYARVGFVQQHTFATVMTAAN